MLRVEGAGVLAVNGIFAPDGHANGKQRWRHSSVDVWLRVGSDGRWCIVNNPNGEAFGGRAKEYYYNTGSDSACWEKRQFALDQDGREPLPTVSVVVEESSSIPWPLSKMRRVLSTSASAPLGPAVILTTGGMNPVHLGHVQLLHQARFRLEREGYVVTGMWLSPSHDRYLLPKAKSLGTIGLSAGFRLEVARQATEDDPLIAVGAWESQQPGQWPDFPIVTLELENELAKFDPRPVVFYACGTDHAQKCSLYHGMSLGTVGIVVVPRSGDIAQQENPERRVFVAEPAAGEVASFSSTRVRAAIAANDYDSVAQCMSGKAAALLLRPSLETYSAFASDFAQLGVSMPTPRRRQIYISLSSIFRMWNLHGEALLSKIPDDALFFFGSKRSWVFPADQAEDMESRKENANYTKPVYQQIRSLILQKELRNQVFFLKPPGFVYNGDLFHGDPAAFSRASEWLVQHLDPMTDKPFSPLLLNADWWKTVFIPANAAFERNVDCIIKNFQCGAHDYGPVKELLHQANPNLEPIM